MNDPNLYRLHILACIEKIEHYCGGRADRLGEPLVFDAVLRNLQTLSEATLRLPDDFTVRNPQIPWSRLARFHNILVHDCLGAIDPVIVWRVIETELPLLQSALRVELPADGPGVNG